MIEAPITNIEKETHLVLGFLVLLIKIIMTQKKKIIIRVQLLMLSKTPNEGKSFITV